MSTKTAERVVYEVEKHLAQEWQRVADVVLGPRREGWFNAEAFVGLSRGVNPFEDGGFSMYGEESISSVAKKVGASKPGQGVSKGRIPDLVGYFPVEGDDAFAFVYEAKVVYTDDSNIADVLDELASQVANASAAFPGVPCIGVVYAVANPRGHNPEPFFKSVSEVMESKLPDANGYRWVMARPVHPVANLRAVMTSMAYPTACVSVGVGARVLAG
jgi:hypothetical protein